MSSQRVLLVSIVVFCAACGGSGQSVVGKAFLLGQADHSGTRVVIYRGSDDVVASARTDSSGAYRIAAPDGAYDLHFEHDGYASTVQPDVVVGKNGISVPDVTLRRGESIDAAPLLSAQPLGSTKVLVQFDEGIDSPSRILDLATGKTQKVAAGSVRVLASNEKFATVRIGRLYRLALETAAMDPVDPPEGDPTQGFAAGGYYVYTGLDGKLNALATGQQTAVIFDASTCARFSFATGSTRDDTPGWLEVPGTQNCNSLATLRTLMNPSLHVLSGAFSTLFVRSRFAFLLAPEQPHGGVLTLTLRRLDLTTGDEDVIRDGISSVVATPDGNSLLLIRPSTSIGATSYAFVDLRTGLPTDVAVDATVMQSYLVNPLALLVHSSAGSTLIRGDTGTATTLCGGNAFPVFGPGRSIPVGLACFTAGTLVAYDWEADSLRTLSTSATSGVSLFGSVVTWNEGPTLRAARVVGEDAPVTLCTTGTLNVAAVSSGGEAAALVCRQGDDFNSIAVDLRTGASRTLLAAAPGSSANIFYGRIALTSGGRGAFLSYTTDAPASDPVNCGTSQCTVLIDLQTGQTAMRNDLLFGAFPNASPDDRGFLVNDPALGGDSLLATFGADGPTFLPAPPASQVLAIGGNERAALLVSNVTVPFRTVLADLTTNTTTPVSSLNSSPLGSSDYVVAEGIAHLDTGVLETLPNGWAPFCNAVRDPLLFLDPAGTTLQEYLPDSGVRTVASGVRTVTGNCGGPILLLSSSDGERGTLLRYASDSGALTRIADDVSTIVPGTFLERFAFQHPDASSGDLLRLAPDGTSVIPLQARAHLQTQFIEAGKRVAFTGGGADSDPKLMVANLDGSGARTLGPAADRILFSPDGAHLLFEARGLLWGENPLGAAVPFDELGRTGKVVVSGSGQYLVYSVLTGERRGTYRIDLGPSCTASSSGCTGPAAVF